MLWKNKFAAEFQWWLRETAEVILPWYLQERLGAWGYALPDAKVVEYPSSWQNAVATLARLQTTYYPGHLQIPSTYNCGRLLDIGCGPLLPARHLRYDELWVVDPLLECYSHAGFPVQEVGAMLLPMNAEDMWVFPAGMFDTIVSVNAMDHLDNFQSAITEIERLLKPTGLLRLAIHYHAPTNTEPLALTDELVIASAKELKLQRIGGHVDAQGMIMALWSNRNEPVEGSP